MENQENKQISSNITNKLTLPAAIVVAGVLIAGAILITMNPNPTPQAGLKSDVVFKAVSADDHILGSQSAKIVIVEYADIDCPFCQRFHPTMHKIVNEYKGDVAWVYRHFPLDSIHPQARKKAEATECAATLGGSNGFWKYLDRIFEARPTNGHSDPEELYNIADYVGLDKEAFKTCLDSGQYAKRVEEQYQSGLKAGVQGAPHSFILKKGKQVGFIQGAESFESVRAKIDALLK